MRHGTATSTVAHPIERDWDQPDYERTSHERPGERERIAFHVHEFDHGCYGQHCSEADRLYAAWHAAVVKSPVGHHR
jgi:hypothetical protein